MRTGNIKSLIHILKQKFLFIAYRVCVYVWYTHYCKLKQFSFKFYVEVITPDLSVYPNWAFSRQIRFNKLVIIGPYSKNIGNVIRTGLIRNWSSWETDLRISRIQIVRIQIYILSDTFSCVCYGSPKWSIYTGMRVVFCVCTCFWACTCVSMYMCLCSHTFWDFVMTLS
jgi:hypothetical protein